MDALRSRAPRLIAPLLLVGAVGGCASSSGTPAASTPPATASATSASPVVSATRTDWYGADPQELAAALGATGYAAHAKDTAVPIDYRSGSATFNGVTVDISTFATPADQAKNAALQQGVAGSLPVGVAVSYATTTGGQVTQSVGPDGLTPEFSTQSKQTAQAAVEALPGSTLVVVASTQK